jgi:F0F1-type ATP synthase membrane subunit b/b'
MEKILGDREEYVDGLLQMAHRLKKESASLNQDSDFALENAQTDFLTKEFNLLSAFREGNRQEKERLGKLFTEKSDIESDRLEKSFDEIFREVSAKTDAIAAEALAGIFRADGSGGEKR